ncbi:MAG: TetM/TetW/TetO/TetS family tetracycline resistance ribosomal protection protein [Oscillospiraceae bacterium]|nr:TetM/TetW/TetO/TetS family tetracycline resistance ribosomal protection protein [Oscillospiraceae bacterium]
MIMNKTAVGIFAHVDAGKTTLCEALLFRAGVIRRLGRVDHRDSWFDTHALERSRGVTIFSKQASFVLGDTGFTLLDTPGHVDFAAEAERTMPVTDMAVLVISGPAGVQSHTATLWKLLRRYHIPTLIFVTKMDMYTSGSTEILRSLRMLLSPNAVDFTGGIRDGILSDTLQEEIAALDEGLMDSYLDGSEVTSSDASSLFADCRLFPCVFGSGLKLDGVDDLISALLALAPRKEYGEKPAAKVYKITRDRNDVRLTHIKVTGGTVNVRDSLKYESADGMLYNEKVTGIRIYSGERYTSADSASAGDIVAVTGLEHTFAGGGLGEETGVFMPVLEPVMVYRIALPAGSDPRTVLPKLSRLEEEDPLLRIVWDERLGEIHANIMGDLQGEVLRSLIESRFGISVEIDEGRVLYKETISSPVEGVGHFEPLRHYAEVHLIIEPNEPGTGIEYGSICHTDDLAINWQRLILSSLEEKQHVGVLGGFPLTDVRILIASGRAHLKHTEGGDFREASWRAVRQGLMHAENMLLEPFYNYRLIVPSELVGRAINDIRAMSGDFSPEQMPDGNTVLTGSVPVSEMQGYASAVASYTGGRGSLSCVSAGYRPCHNSQEVLERTGYDPERDVQNTPDSVFCRHGAGFTVKWDQVPNYMHLQASIREKKDEPEVRSPGSLNLDEKALESLMEREFGPIRRRQYGEASVVREASSSDDSFSRRNRLILDGYNVIFAWDDLNELSKKSLDLARTRLMDIMSDYSGFTGTGTVIVFDAYRSTDSAGKRFNHHGVDVVFTDAGQSADAYIEKLSQEIGKDESVKVVSSDNLVRTGVSRSGVMHMSSRSLKEEVDRVGERISSLISSRDSASPSRLGDFLDDEVIEKWRQILNL